MKLSQLIFKSTVSAFAALVVYCAATAATLFAAEPASTLTLVSYNVHNAIGLDGKTDFARIAKTLTALNPDVVALQELDSKTKRSKGRDVLEEIAKEAKMNATFGPAIDFQGGKYGIGVFELGYPKNNGRFDSNVTAKKSYFMFDNEVVCVGSGISDDSNTMVYTTIENRIWRKDDVFSADGKAVSLTDKEIADKVKYMHFTNMGGYVFLEETDVKYRKAVNKNSFLEIVTEHGKNPDGAKYAYIYLPEATNAETAAYSASPDVEILAQSNLVHVVRENKLGVTGYVFYGAGGSNGVKVDNACALMVRQEDGKTVVSVSDPSHLLTSLKITLTLDGITALESADPEIKASVSGNTVTLDLSIEGNVGNTFVATFK